MTDLSRQIERVTTATDDYTGPVLAGITCPDGSIYVTVDPNADVAAVRILTHEQPDSPAADAVRASTVIYSRNHLTITVPAYTRTRHQGSVISGGSGVSYINGVQYTGPVTVVNGVVTSGGLGVHTVSTGIEVHVTLPADSAVRCRTENGSLTTSGILAGLDVGATNGSIRADTVAQLKASATNGSVHVARITDWIHAQAINGSVRVGEYAGSACYVSAGNGSVTLTAGAEASGLIEVRAGNGSVKLYGVTGRTDLDIDATAAHGTVRRY